MRGSIATLGAGPRPGHRTMAGEPLKQSELAPQPAERPPRPRRQPAAAVEPARPHPRPHPRAPPFGGQDSFVANIPIKSEVAPLLIGMLATSSSWPPNGAAAGVLGAGGVVGAGSTAGTAAGADVAVAAAGCGAGSDCLLTFTSHSPVPRTATAPRVAMGPLIFTLILLAAYSSRCGSDGEEHASVQPRCRMKNAVEIAWRFVRRTAGRHRRRSSARCRTVRHACLPSVRHRCHLGRVVGFGPAGDERSREPSFMSLVEMTDHRAAPVSVFSGPRPDVYHAGQPAHIAVPRRDPMSRAS